MTGGPAFGIAHHLRALGEGARPGHPGGGQGQWELTDPAPTPRLAEALAAVGEGRAGRAFEVGLTAFVDHARAPREKRAEIG
ncbi:hypothetical protein [Streptomyces sp. NPDC001450]